MYIHLQSLRQCEQVGISLEQRNFRRLQDEHAG